MQSHLTCFSRNSIAVRVSQSRGCTFVIIAVTSLCSNITCESVPVSPPPFLFFIGVRGEPGNEAFHTCIMEPLQ